MKDKAPKRKYRIEYYIPGDRVTWTIELDHAPRDWEALDLIKEDESIKRVPPTWKIWIEKEDGSTIEINRRAVPRHRKDHESVIKALEKEQTK